MAQVDEFLAEMLPRWRSAYRALCTGDVEPWAAIWSTRDPVTLFGAAGSATGASEVRRVQERVATHFTGLVNDKYEVIAAGACGDLAYTVALEHKTVDTPGGEPATYTLRTTHVFRREDGAWRIVHRHGDRPPDREDFPIASTPGTTPRHPGTPPEPPALAAAAQQLARGGAAGASGERYFFAVRQSQPLTSNKTFSEWGGGGSACWGSRCPRPARIACLERKLQPGRGG